MTTPDQAKTVPARRELAERFARETVRWGMGTPAILFLEMTRPMSVINSSFLTVAEPLLGMFLPVSRPDYMAFCELTAGRDGVETLIQSIEQQLNPPSESKD